jgi:hypothetical protein
VSCLHRERDQFNWRLESVVTKTQRCHTLLW